MIPNDSPFKAPIGPKITPKAMSPNSANGGQQNPAYLQMKRPAMVPGQAMTNPVVTPKPMAPGDTVRGPQITPPMNNGIPSAPPQAGGNSLGDVYKFFASDLGNQAKQAKSSAIADASARGVYYGTPLTGSEADIDTQYLRGLGQLQAGMYGNEQENQLRRLGMAVNLGGQAGNNMPQAPGPMDFSGLGALFGSGTPAGPGATAADTRKGPAITPANGRPTNQSNGLGITPYDPNQQKF